MVAARSARRLWRSGNWWRQATLLPGTYDKNISLQIVAQALRAAFHTVPDDFRVHVSFHAFVC